jgi:hypothetical protein
LNYQWTKKSGGNVANMTGDTTLTLSFTTPNTETTLVFELKAIDSATSFVYDTDDIIITVKSPSALEANAGPDHTRLRDRNKVSGWAPVKIDNGDITSAEKTASEPTGVGCQIIPPSSIASFTPILVLWHLRLVDITFQLM